MALMCGLAALALGGCGGGASGGTSGSGWGKLNIGQPVVAQDIIVVGSRLVLSTNQGVLVSNDDGQTWYQSVSGLQVDSVGTMVAVESVIFAEANDGRYVSNDQGDTWTSAAAMGLPTDTSIVTALAVGKDLFVGMNAPSPGALFKSSDWGMTFAASSTGLPQNEAVSGLATDGNNIYSVPMLSVGRSSDSGATWQTSMLPTPDNVLQVAAVGGAVLAGTAGGAVFSSPDASTWTAADNGLPSGAPIDLLFADAGKVYASSSGATGIVFGVYVSSDLGAHWTAFNEGFGADPPHALAMASHGGYLFVVAEIDGVWRRKL
jgi:hypothetical protein